MIANLDVFVHHLGPVCHPIVIELLSNEKLDVEMAEALSLKIGSILCAMSKKTKFERKYVNTGQIMEDVSCQICLNAVSGDEQVHLNKALFMKLFQQLMGHEKKEVQINIVSSLLKPMARHKMIDQG